MRVVSYPDFHHGIEFIDDQKNTAEIKATFSVNMETPEKNKGNGLSSMLFISKELTLLFSFNIIIINTGKIIVVKTTIFVIKFIYGDISTNEIGERKRISFNVKSGINIGCIKTEIACEILFLITTPFLA